MKKVWKWIGGLLLVPVVLFVVLSTLLYIPPVQRFLVGWASDYASQATGYEVRVGAFHLGFPLDLKLADVTALDAHRDTLLRVESLRVDVALHKLLRGVVEVEELELNAAYVDTKDLIPALVIRGGLEQFMLDTREINLFRSEANLHRIALDGADVEVTLLPDTTAQDSASAPVNWVVNLQEVTLSDARLTLLMPADSMRVHTLLNRVQLEEGHLDLGRQVYRVNGASLRSDSLLYDLLGAPYVSGLDPNHVRVTDVDIRLDSVSFSALPSTSLALALNRFTAKEVGSGLQVTSLTTDVRMDSASLLVPNLELLTRDSRLQLMAHLPWTALEAGGAEEATVYLNGALGKQDLLRMAGELPHDFVRRYPNNPLTLRASVVGTLQHLLLEELKVALPGAFELKGNAYVDMPLDSLHRNGEMNLHLQTQDLNFAVALMDTARTKRLYFPPMNLDGRLMAEGSHFRTDFTLREDTGRVTLNGGIDLSRMTYDAALNVKDLQLKHFLPADSLGLFTAHLALDGAGTDFLSPRTRLMAQAQIDRLEYGTLDFDKVNLKARVRDGKGHVDFDSDNGLLQLASQFDALMTRPSAGLSFSVDLRYADFYAMRLTPKPLTASMCLHLDGNTNFKDTHAVQGGISDLVFHTADTLYRPRDLTVDALLRPDTLYAYVSAGDLSLNASAHHGVDEVLRKADSFLAELTRQLDEKRIDQDTLKTFLPEANVRIRSGRDNPVANYLATLGYRFNDFTFDLRADPEVGLNGGGHVFAIRTGAVTLDTVQWHIYQDITGVKMDGRVRNGPKNKQFVFDARTNLNLYATGAGLTLAYVDGRGRKGVNLGLRADVEENGLRLSFAPLRPIIAYRTFQLNDSNFVYLGNDGRVKADMDLLADDGTGLKLFTVPNEEALQDISLSLHSLNLGELTSVLPYAPRITGLLHGDLHLVQTPENLSLAADMSTEKLVYEGAPLGRVGLNGVYLPNTDGSHMVDAQVTLEDEDVMALSGTYFDDSDGGSLDARAELFRFPLALANGFLPEGLMSLAGYVDGAMTVSGPLSRPLVDGGITLDSVHIKSPEYSLALRVENDSIVVHRSNLQIKDLRLYSLNENPLVINGSADFSNFENVRVNTQITSRNFELVNAPRTQQASLYGKVYVDFNAMVRGTLTDLTMMGQLNVLGNTDVTYVLKDSPLTVEDRLGDLVTFMDFSDTEGNATAAPRPRPTSLNMTMRLNVDQAARIHCLLSADRSNYIDLEGGGELTMTFNPQSDLQLNGRYTVLSGEMKYSLPVIPLKTFNLKSGSYVEFTGDVLNPTLNIAATERVRTTVTENNSPRTVSFDVGLSITRRLSDMGLEFTLEAPEDLTIQNELASMSVEQRGRLAVTMLATGMYLANSNLSGGGFNTQNALNAFLQSEISNITGNALKTIDLTVGMENSTSATGDTHTDYSFRFAKRFWGNRISVIVGGKVTTGNEEANVGQSLIDNVSVEYRLDKSATRYVKVFYDRSYESLIEGELTEMGAGLVLRRKMTKLGELFIFRRKDEAPKMPSGTDVSKK